MPEISRFLGIIVAMFYNDHNPPHFHVRYGGHRATFSINDLTLLEGDLPKRVILLVLEWAYEHREALQQNWQLAKDKKPLQPISPLV